MAVGVGRFQWIKEISSGGMVRYEFLALSLFLSGLLVFGFSHQAVVVVWCVLIFRKQAVLYKHTVTEKAATTTTKTVCAPSKAATPNL